jgi:hypothetical protein
MRRGIASWLAFFGLLLLAPSASASYHLMKISEIGQGGGGGPDYVELQMYAGGQNFVGGHSITTYGPTGSPMSTFTFPAGVSQGANQRTILVARDDGSLPVTADFVTADLVLPTNGAACFIDTLPLNGIDCVAFGTFTGFSGGAPSPVGTPAPAPAPGGALERSIAPGCATLLESGDDTDDSSADFALATPSPRPNSVAPTETPCTGGGGADTDPPQTKIKKAPKGKIDADTVKVKFKSDEPNSTFECKFDRKPYKPCKSPKRLKNLDDGKHKFKVRATDAAGNTDTSPAKAKFKVVD